MKQLFINKNATIKEALAKISKVDIDVWWLQVVLKK